MTKSLKSLKAGFDLFMKYMLMHKSIPVAELMLDEERRRFLCQALKRRVEMLGEIIA